MIKNQRIGDIDLGHNDALKDKKLLQCYLDNGVINEIFKNNKNFIFGRKGAGKSAVCNYINKTSNYNRDSIILSFYDFPMEILYKFTDRDYRAPSQYQTLWKYIIYLEFGKLILKDQSIVVNEYWEKLKKIIEMNFNNLDISYNEIVSKTKDIGFKLSLPEEYLGLGFEIYKSETIDGIAKVPYNRVVALLEECIKNINYNAENKYILLFDELDKKYDLTKEYKDLLISLFDVVNEINYMFDSNDFVLKCVVFLRTDILNYLKTTDMNKISDERIDLNWLDSDNTTTSNLRKLINLRIEDSIEELKDSYDSWNKCFELNLKREQTTYDYIVERTYHRPRDIIQFCKECVNQAKTKNEISWSDIEIAEYNYSKWLKAELIDEMQIILEPIDIVFDALREIGTQVFSYKQFERTIKEYRELSSYDAYEILRLLFEFNVIGDYNNRYRKKRIFFLYKSYDESIKFKCKPDDEFIVFRGLNKTLKLKPVSG